MTKQSRTSSNKKARKDTISQHANNKKNEDNVMKDFFTKYLHNKKSKIGKMSKKSHINKKRNKIHKRNKSNKKGKRTPKNKIQNIKRMDSEVKNAVAQLESLIQEKNKMNINSNDHHAIIERRDKIRIANENDNTVFLRPVKPTTSWFKRDLKETEADYYPSAIKQMSNYQSERGYTRSEITGSPRSALRNPADLEKELLAKVEKAKRLLKENFINKRNQTNGINEEDSAKVDSLLLSKYEKQNSVLTNKLTNMLNDTKSVDNILNKLENEDEEENFLLKKENKAIAKHLVKSADDIYANDKRKLMEIDGDLSRSGQQPDTNKAKKELYDMVALTNDTNSNVNNRNSSESGGDENVEEFTKSTSMNSSYDRDNIESSNHPDDGFSSLYQRKGEQLFNTVLSARNETNESIFPSVVNASKVNPVPAEERNLTFTLDDEKQQQQLGVGASTNETYDKENVTQDYDGNYPKEESGEHPKGGFVSIDNNKNNNNHKDHNMAFSDVEGMRNTEKPINEESTQSQNEMKLGIAEDTKPKEETAPKDNDTDKPNENKEEESGDPKKQKMKEKKGREPMVQLAGPNSFGFGIANNNTFQNAITNKTKSTKGDDKKNEKQDQEGNEENPKESEDLKDKDAKTEKEGKPKDPPKPKDEKKTTEEDLKDLKPEKEEKSAKSKDEEKTYKDDPQEDLKHKKEDEEDERTPELEEDHGKKATSSKPGDESTKNWKDLEETSSESKPKNHAEVIPENNKSLSQGKDNLDGDHVTSISKNATQQQVEYEMLDYEKKTKDDKKSSRDDSFKKMDDPKEQQDNESKAVDPTTMKNEDEDTSLENNDPFTTKEMLDYDKNVKLKNKTMELASLDQIKQKDQQNKKEGQDIDSDQQTNTKHKAMELENEGKDGKQKDEGHSKKMAKEMLAYDETVRAKNKTVSGGDISQKLKPSKQNADDGSTTNKSEDKKVKTPDEKMEEEKPPKVSKLPKETPEEKEASKTPDLKMSPKKEDNEAPKLPKEEPEEKLMPKKEESETSKLPKEKQEEIAPKKEEKEASNLSEKNLEPKKEESEAKLPKEKQEEMVPNKEGNKTPKLPEEKLAPKKEEDKLEKSPKTPEEQLKLDVEKTKQDASKIDASTVLTNNNHIKADVGHTTDSVISKAADSNLQNTSLTNGYSKKVFELFCEI